MSRKGFCAENRGHHTQLTEWLVRHRRFKLVRELLLLYGLDIPAAVKIGPGFTLQHRGIGTVLHPATVLGSNVTIYHRVTVGRADSYVPFEQSRMTGIRIGDGAVLCAGAVVLAKEGVLTVGEGTVIGANAVLTQSTGPWEIWAGAPARCVGQRKR